MAINLKDSELAEAVRREHPTDRLITEVLDRFATAIDPHSELNSFSSAVNELSWKIEFDDLLKILKSDAWLVLDPRITPLLTEFSQAYLARLEGAKMNYANIIFENENAVTILTILQVYLDRKDTARKAASLARIRRSQGKSGGNAPQAGA